MPRYEYECPNGHRREVVFSFAAGPPPTEMWEHCHVITHAPSNNDLLDDELCQKPLKRVYSVFSFRMA